MLEQIKQENLKKKDISCELEKLRLELNRLEIEIKDTKMPVIVIFEGWSASGKGTMISKLIKYLDPRFYKVVSVRTPDSRDKCKPWLWRHWINLPQKGNMLILDRSWYRDTVNAYMYGEISKAECKKRFDDINNFERELADDGYLIVKFFLHISEDEQKNRIEKLNSSEITDWRVDKHDRFNMKHYGKFFKQYDKMLEHTNTVSAVWNVIPSDDKQNAELTILRTAVSFIKSGLELRKNNKQLIQKSEYKLFDYKKPEFVTVPQPLIQNVPLDKTMTDEEYEKQLKKCQKKLFELQNICYMKKIPVIIAYEGWDAGGKGGNIKRVASALDPRGYEVKPISAPEPSELARHYLWRFWKRLENDGHFTIFDRTWYGRVMVEPIENLTPQDRVDMAYDEINEFEKLLVDWGAVVIKFWIQIDKDEQLKRFRERENTPEKRWKITDEDWRNREKWDKYEIAVNKMIEKTSTENAPWTVIEGNDKKYARIKALKTIINRISEKIKE